MTINEIVKLTEAGFTKDEIMAMAGAGQTGQPEDQTKTDPADIPAKTEPDKPADLDAFINKVADAVASKMTPKEEPKEEPKEDPEPAGAAGQDPALQQILSLLHNDFIKTTEQPEQPSAEDIITSIIDPAPPKKEE